MASANIRDVPTPPMAAMPPRSISVMPSQPLIPWTPARMARFALTWLMEEQQLEYRR
jgi:hypothetical protein